MSLYLTDIRQGKGKAAISIIPLLQTRAFFFFFLFVMIRCMRAFRLFLIPFSSLIVPIPFRRFITDRGEPTPLFGTHDDWWCLLIVIVFGHVKIACLNVGTHDIISPTKSQQKEYWKTGMSLSYFLVSVAAAAAAAAAAALADWNGILTIDAVFGSWQLGIVVRSIVPLVGGWIRA